MWYAVTFPSWEGYRVEHDQTYTAYTSFEAGSKVADDDDDGDTPGFGAVAVLAGMGVVVVVMAVLRRREW